MNRFYAATLGFVFVLGACVAPPPPPPTVHRVSMLGSLYSPSTINARVGDTLLFVNDDGESHTVFVPTRGFGVDFGPQRPNENREIQLALAGTFRVECVPHANMQLFVNVR
jgi:plastocyanin